MERREFLGIAAAGAAGLMLPGSLVRAGGSPALSALAQPALLGILNDPARVSDIGRRYRRDFPAEDAPQALEAAIRADAGAGTPESLDRTVHTDFAQGRTVVVQGWVLSVTEARQCALFSLYHS